MSRQRLAGLAGKAHNSNRAECHPELVGSGPLTMTTFKMRLKKVIPKSILQLRRRYIARKMQREFVHCRDAKDIFTLIYDRHRWGKSKNRDDRYYSGPGSHKSEIVDAYVSAVTQFLLSMRKRPDVVDLGCGDFAVGARIRPYCGRYIACDVVEGLISRNKTKYAESDVEFRVVDIINDELPDGEVAIIRQVLQHLSNSAIEKIVAKLSSTYRFLIIAEHLVLADGFAPNREKPTGPGIRGDHGDGGVILTEPPFNLEVEQTTLLCEVFADAAQRGVIRTNLYRL
jgi:SAM-dependent methyltransferase